MSDAEYEAAISAVQAVRFDAPNFERIDDAEILALLREVAIYPVLIDTAAGGLRWQAAERVLAKRGYNVDEVRVVARESSRLYRRTQAALDE